MLEHDYYQMEYIFHSGQGFKKLRYVDEKIPLEHSEFKDYLEKNGYNITPSVLQGNQTYLYAVYKKNVSNLYLTEIFIDQMRDFFFVSSTPGMLELIFKFNRLLLTFNDLDYPPTYETEV